MDTLISDTAKGGKGMNPIKRCGTLIASADSESLFDDHQETTEKLEEFGGFLLLRIAHDWARTLECILAPSQISKNQFMVLSLAHHLQQRHDEVTATRISQLASLSYDVICTATSELEQRGLVSCSEDTDSGQPIAIHLTSTGLQTHLRTKRQVKQSWQQMFDKHQDVESELTQSLELIYHMGL